MAVLPSQGGSDGVWGTEVRAYIHQEHDTNGHHTFIVCNENQVVCNENKVVSNPTTF